MNRLNRILVGFLALQLVIAAIVLWPRPAATGEGERLFPGLEAERISGLTITGADGQSIRLVRSGDRWVLPTADDYPVQEGKVSPLLDKFAGLETGRLVTQTSDSHKRLGVAEDGFERLVELELEDGTHYQLYVGTSPSFSVSHVRAGGGDEVYLASNLSPSDVGTQAADWVDRSYFSLSSDQVVALTLENQSGRFEFARTGDTWTMEGLSGDETLDEAAVQSLLNRATSVTMLQPLGQKEQAAYGLESPSATVVLQTLSDGEEDRTYTLSVGTQDPQDGSYVLISSESPYYVRVSEFAVKDFVEKVRDDLLEQPPESETGATPESP
jgi:hypothetical protein